MKFIYILMLATGCIFGQTVRVNQNRNFVPDNFLPTTPYTFTTDGSNVLTVPSFQGFPTGGANTGIDYDGNNLWIAIFETGNIDLYSVGGGYQSTITTNIGADDLQGIAIVSDGFWAALPISRRFAKYDFSGTEILNFPTGSFRPAGIAFQDSTGELFVSSQSSNSIRVYDQTGVILRTIPTPATNVDGISFGANGDLIVTADGVGFANSNISRINPSNGFLINQIQLDVDSIEHIVEIDGNYFLNVDDGFHRNYPDGNRVYNIDQNGDPVGKDLFWSIDFQITINNPDPTQNNIISSWDTTSGQQDGINVRWNQATGVFEFLITNDGDLQIIRTPVDFSQATRVQLFVTDTTASIYVGGNLATQIPWTVGSGITGLPMILGRRQVGIDAGGFNLDYFRVHRYGM